MYLFVWEMSTTETNGELLEHLISHHEKFLTVRTYTVHVLGEVAQKMERTGRICKAGKLAGKSITITGGVISLSAAITCITAGTASPATVPVMAVGSATAAIGGAVSNGCKAILHVKNRRRMVEVGTALKQDCVGIRTLLSNLFLKFQNFDYEPMLNTLLECKDVMDWLCHCSPEEVASQSQLLDEILGDVDVRGFGSDEVNDFLAKVIDIPGIRGAFEGCGMLQVGADDIVEIIGELIVGNFLPLRAIGLPLHILSLARGIHRFRKGTYKKVASCIRKVSQKLKDDGEKYLKQLRTIIKVMQELKHAAHNS